LAGQTTRRGCASWPSSRAEGLITDADYEAKKQEFPRRW
jgi:hypothetical protein